LQVVSAADPAACHDEHRVYVWMPLDATAALPPTPDALRIMSAEDAQPMPPTPTERSNGLMPAPQPNHTPDNGQANGTEPDRMGLADAIAEAEALRALLHDASARTARLLAALKHQRRQSRAVQQAMASLRQLRLDR